MKGLGKLGTLFMVLVLCTTVVGIGYAAWSDTLTITGSVATGDIDAQMRLAVNADGANYVGNPTSPDTTYYPGAGCRDDGIWDSPGQWDVNWETALEGPIVNDFGVDPGPYNPLDLPDAVGCLLTKNVGETSVKIGEVVITPANAATTWGKSMTITITNAYPNYTSGVSFLLSNAGSVPIELMGFNAVGPIPSDLFLAIEDFPPYMGTYGLCGFQLIETGSTFLIPDEYRQQLDPNVSRLTGLLIWLPDAEETTTYNFALELLTQQWNAP